MKDAAREMMESQPGILKLTYRQRGAAGASEPAPRIIDRLSFEDLFDLLRLGGEPRSSLLDRRRAFWFANGFQSWSPGWELGRRERAPRARLMKRLEIYTLPDVPRPPRRELSGNGIAYVRAGETYVGLVSLNTKTAPVCFRIDRGRRSISIELHCKGAMYHDGEVLAEIALVSRNGCFEFQDAVAALFLDKNVMARAAFLAGSADGLVGGWCSWYNHYTHIDETIIREDLEGIGGSPNLIREQFQNQGRPVVFQVDDGWQRAVGDWQAKPERFPSGMKALAESIFRKGYVPGLWLAPFLVSPGARIYSEKPQWLLKGADGKPALAGWNPGWEGNFFCLDLSLEEVRKYLRELFDAVIDDWGFRYLKLDFLYAGMLNGAHASGGSAYAWYREALEPIVSRERSRSGQPVAFLGCGAPLASSIDLFPLMRIGADTKETWDPPVARLTGHPGRPAAYLNLKDTLGRSFMNRSLYLSDPDVVFMRSNKCSLTINEKELIAAVAAMFSSQILISDDTGSFGGPGEAELTAWTLSLYKRLAGRQFGAVMIGKDMWRCFSRDGEIRGIINVRSCPARIGAKDAASWKLTGAALIERARRDSSGVVVQPRSIALWT